MIFINISTNNLISFLWTFFVFLATLHFNITKRHKMEQAKKTFFNNLSLVLIVIIFFITSFIIMKKSFSNTENELKIKLIYNLIERIEDKIDIQEKLNKNIIKLQNVDYEKLFNDFNLNYFIIINNNKTKNKFTNIKEINNQNFENILRNSFNKNNIKFIKYKQEIYLANKIVENKKEYYLVSHLSNKELQSLGREFLFISFDNKTLINTFSKSFKFASSHFFNIDVIIDDVDNFMESKISFYDNNDYLFTIRTKNKKLLQDKSQNTLKVFILSLIVFLVLILIILYKYKENLKRNESELEKKVNSRTNQIKKAMQELEHVNKKLYEIAHTDFLTKTMNRRNFFTKAHKIFNESNDENTTISLILLDLDNLKEVNEIYSQDAGDKVLECFANTVRLNINKEYLFARLGGEEFAILMKNSNLDEAVELASNLRYKIEQNYCDYSQLQIKITASFGVANSKDCLHFDDLIKIASKYLYYAKDGGKNQVKSGKDFK